MLRFTKGPEPASLAKWRSKANDAWDVIDLESKSDLRDGACRDQGALCAYCQRRIRRDVDDHGRPETRIEHWLPRSRGGPPFVWSNLLGVCSGESEGSRHCDASKGDKTLFLHPVEGQGPDPRLFLRYLANGEVYAEDPRAANDIRVVALNTGSMARNRVQAFEAVKLRLDRKGWSLATIQRELELCERAFQAGRGPEYIEAVRYWLRKRSMRYGG